MSNGLACTKAEVMANIKVMELQNNFELLTSGRLTLQRGDLNSAAVSLLRYFFQQAFKF
jgi:hypothetical protein